METKNYIKEYYKNKEHDLSSILNVDVSEDEKVKEIKKEIANMLKMLDNKSVELHNTLENLYSNRFTPISKTNIIRYNGRVDDFLYNLETGLLVENDDIDFRESVVYSVDKSSLT